METKKRTKNKSVKSNYDNQSDYDSDEEVFEMSNVKVRVIHSYKAKGHGELSIIKGQILKQLKPANKDKMAYGCINKYMVCRQYGFYPAHCVVLKPKQNWNQL